MTAEEVGDRIATLITNGYAKTTVFLAPDHSGELHAVCRVVGVDDLFYIGQDGALTKAVIMSSLPVREE